MDGHVELLELRGHVARHRGVADVRVDFRERGDADAHRLEALREVHAVRGDDHAAPPHLRADRLLGQVLATGDEGHLRRDLVPPRGFELGHGSVSESDAALAAGSSRYQIGSDRATEPPLRAS